MARPRFVSRTPDLSPASLDWATELDRARLTTTTPREVLLDALGLEIEYLRPPSSLNGHLVRARAESSTEGRGRPFGLVLAFRFGRVQGECERCPYHQGVCRHGVALLADLALSAPLRASLSRGTVDPLILHELPALRRAWAIEMRLAEALGDWLPRPTGALLYGVSVQLSFVALPGFRGSTPGFELRLRHPSVRGLLEPSTSMARLEAPLRRALELTEPAGSGRKALFASGPAASCTIALLRGQQVTTEGSPMPVRWATDTVRVRISHERVPRESLGRPLAGPQDSLFRPSVAPEPPVEALVPRWTTEDGRIDVSARDASFFAGPFPHLWVPSESTFFPVDPHVDPTLAQGFDRTPAVILPEGSAPTVFRTLRQGLRGRTVALPSPERMGLSPVEAPLFLLRLDGDPFTVHAELSARYSFGTFPLRAGVWEAPEGESRALRDETAEELTMARLTTLGLAYDDTTLAFTAAGEEAVIFWTQGLPKLREDASDLEVFVPERLARLKLRGSLQSRVRIGLEDGWLDASMGFSVDGLEADMLALRGALRAGRSWVTLSDGTLARLTDSVRDLVGEAADVVDGSGHARLPIHALGRLEHWADRFEDTTVSPELEALRARLRTLTVNHDAELPAGLVATLRPYQLQGLGWLQFLASLGAGGILADDMGLGKTLMTLAFFQWQKEREGPAPALVVCPTSVVGNWQREAARFAPGLSVVLCHGSGRHARFGELGGADVVVTSYALLRRDVDTLVEVPFRTLVLDEAQHVKNADAETRKVVARLRATHRLALTGTPVENRLGELWSILDLCNPGMLGSARTFEQRFERPIVASAHGHAAAELRARIRPFVLRRTKGQVLEELPEKEEIDLVCAPGPEQQRLYDALAAVLRTEVSENVAEKGLGRSGLVVLTALLRLRQMCCDPRLVDPQRGADVGAKRTAFLELVRELVAEGRRALVFSQFVSLLGLWRQDLDREGIAYEYLDGSTRDRDGAVERFQKGDSPLFLISLKAGGAGLNLTAADTVIHCDPWWNPAVEDQATDRAHRMGQTRKVTVYRLVLKGSIEDKIAVLKAKKRGIADAVVHDDAGALRGLAEDDVALLLSGVDDDDLPRGSEPPTESDAPPPPVSVPPPPRWTAELEPLHFEPRSDPPPGLTPRTSGAPVTGEALTQLIDAVRVWLRRTGTTQGAFARSAGMSAPEVSRILGGYKQRIPGDVAARLREAIRG